MADLLEYIIRVRGGAAGKRDADKAAEGFDNLAGAATRAKIASAGSIPSVNQLSGRIQLMGAAAIFAGPSLVALGASASAAAIGGAAVGGGGVAALVAGLGGFIVIAKQAKDGQTKVTSALNTYRVTAKAFGADSDKAHTAWQRLNGTVQVFGGKVVLDAIRGQEKLGKAWMSMTRSARQNVYGTMVDGITRVRKILPTLATETNKNSGVIRTALAGAFRSLSGNEVRKDITSLSGTFRGMAGPLTKGIVNLFLVMLRVFRAVGPAVVKVAKAFQTWTQGLRSSTSDSGRLNGTMSMLIGQTRAWWGLAKALGRVLVSVFKGSQGEGKSLVGSLTRGADALGVWLEKARGTGKLQGYFKQFGDALIAVSKAAPPILAVIETLAQALLPALKSSAGGVTGVLGLWALQMQAVAKVIAFLGPLAGPLVTAFVAWKIATTQLSIAWAILNVIMDANIFVLIGLAVAALVVGIIYAYKKFDWFRQGVHVLWLLLQAFPLVFLIAHFGTLVRLITGLGGRLAKAGAGIWDWLKTAFRDSINWVLRAWNSLKFKIPEVNTHIPGVGKVGGGSIGVPQVPLLAAGGNIRSGGAAIVGDNGPELLSLPGGAQVTPLAGAHPTGGRDIVLRVSGRELGRVTAREIAESQARG